MDENHDNECGHKHDECCIDNHSSNSSSNSQNTNIFKNIPWNITATTRKFAFCTSSTRFLILFLYVCLFIHFFLTCFHRLCSIVNQQMETPEHVWQLAQ
eukprot:552101_1